MREAADLVAVGASPQETSCLFRHDEQRRWGASQSGLDEAIAFNQQRQQGERQVEEEEGASACEKEGGLILPERLWSSGYDASRTS